MLHRIFIYLVYLKPICMSNVYKRITPCESKNPYTEPFLEFGGEANPSTPVCFPHDFGATWLGHQQEIFY